MGKPVEVLSDILRSMHVRGSVYFCDQLYAPWTLDFEQPTSAAFHLVRRGECWVTSDGLVERLGPGDMVFIEPGRDHYLAGHRPGTEPVSDDHSTLLLCGYCEFSQEYRTPLHDVFPSLTVVREEEFAKRPWLKGTLDQLSSEYLSQAPGAELVVDKLTEIVLVELIRIDFGRDGKSRFVKALTDRQISQALQHLHNNPHVHWTIESLAAKIGMSRAALAKRFKELVGYPVFEYLTRLRVQRAQALLRETPLPLYEIANRVGYDSDLAFTKTFKKHTGTTPTRYRKAPDETSIPSGAN